MMADGHVPPLSDHAGMTKKRTAAERSRTSEHPHIWFLLDRSGSMHALFQDVVLGLQEFIREQRLADADARLTLVQFDSDDVHDVLLDAMPLAEVDEERAARRFEPRGATPLYDAIAAIDGRADRWVTSGRGDDADQIVVIFTDGYENASTDCTRDTAFRLIEERRARDWTFVFMGANQDAYEAGAGISVAPGNTASWAATPTGARSAIRTMSKGVARHAARTRSLRRHYKDRFFEEDDGRDGRHGIEGS